MKKRRRHEVGRWAETTIVLGTLVCIAAAVRLAAVKWPGSWVAIVVAGALAVVAFGTLSGLLFDLVGKLGPLRSVAGVTLGVLLLAGGTHASLHPFAYVDAPDPDEPVEGGDGTAPFQAHPPSVPMHDNATGGEAAGRDPQEP